MQNNQGKAVIPYEDSKESSSQNPSSQDLIHSLSTTKRKHPENEACQETLPIKKQNSEGTKNHDP